MVKYESGFDRVINGKCVINDFHEDVLDKSHVFAYLKSPYNDVISANVIMLESLFVKE